jgi:hypothetical protein
MGGTTMIPQQLVKKAKTYLRTEDPVVMGIYGGERITRSGRRLPPSPDFKRLKNEMGQRFYGQQTEANFVVERRLLRWIPQLSSNEPSEN